jgi:hypothetical protein
LSDSGVAIIVQQDIPLFVLKNKTSICLKASSKEPYNKERIVSLAYDICISEKTESTKYDYLNKLQLFVMNQYFSKPTDIPDELMFRYPIWSTWAQFKGNINEQNVKQYASDILAYNFSHSQLEIDDRWQTEYGDFSFDTTKFPNIKTFIGDLNRMNFRTTLWVHPFANIVCFMFYFNNYEIIRD